MSQDTPSIAMGSMCTYRKEVVEVTDNWNWEYICNACRDKIECIYTNYVKIKNVIDAIEISPWDVMECFIDFMRMNKNVIEIKQKQPWIINWSNHNDATIKRVRWNICVNLLGGGDPADYLIPIEWYWAYPWYDWIHYRCRIKP